MNKERLSRRHFIFQSASCLGAALLFGPKVIASPGMSCAESEGLPAFIDPRAWSGEAWKAALPTFEDILRHPFITGLADGTLPQDIFAHYIRQDEIYLAGYARSLSAIAERLPRKEHRELMGDFVTDTLSVERYMHELYQGMNEKHLPPTPAKASPACQAYMDYEARLATSAPVEVACAVILPCFTVYQQVGVHLLATRTKQANPYDAWIDSYSDPSFDTATRAAVAMCDELAEAASSAVRKQMTEAYVNATRMEWRFWDSAWKKEG